MTDNAYSTKTYRLQNLGVNARAIYDALPPGTYQNLRNMESRAENAIASRYGMRAITTDGTQNLPLGGKVTALARMKALSTVYRYATGGTSLYRRTGDGQGAYSSIGTGLSGAVTSMASYRPDNNANPYMFVADGAKLLKDSGSGTAKPWGISPPFIPASALIAQPPWNLVDSFDATPPFSQTTNFTSVGLTFRFSTHVKAIATTGFQAVQEARPVCTNGGLSRTSNVTTVSTQAAHNYVTGMKAAIINPSNTSFNVSAAVITVISPSQFTYANFGPNGTGGSPNTTTISAMPSLAAGMFVAIGGFGNAGGYFTQVAGILPKNLGFYAFAFANPSVNVVNSAYLHGSVAANAIATITRPLSVDLTALNNFQFAKVGGDNDIVQFWINLDDPSLITEIRLAFDVGDGSFTHDYYYKSVSQASWQAAVSGNITNYQQVVKRVADRAAARADNRRLGFVAKDLMPDDVADLRWLRPIELNTGLHAWTLIKCYKSEFVQVGRAGDPGFAWDNVTGWQLTIKAGANSAVSVWLDDLSVIGGSLLDSLSSAPYDYRYTYYNINTGCESNPSPTMLTGTVTPHQQPVQVGFFNPSDSQVTHVRIYRRGGTLTQGWYRVDQIPVAADSAGNNYVDTASDSAIEANPLLEIDNDPPVTTALPNPVNSKILTVPNGGGPGQQFFNCDITNMSQWQLVTIGPPDNQEQAYLQAVDGVNKAILVYCQLKHNVNDPITAATRPLTPMNLLAIAFDKAWLAGDPNNPHVLYWSKPFRPETFAPQNSIEVGSPDAPILALTETRGLLYVFTTKRVYQVIGAGSAVPVIIPTSVKHGLVASQAWAAAENIIYYLSYDGVYAFQGAGSGYLSEAVEWIWTAKNLGPVQAMDPAAIAQTTMAYGNHELFVSYTGLDGTRHRMIWHDVYKRWRNDDSGQADIFGMNFEDDTGRLMVGGLDGMVYQDRTGESDWGTFDSSGTFVPTPIPFTMQTSQMDMEVPKAFKQYNELTLDMDTSGQDVNISLVFDNGATILAIGKFNCSGRQQVQINVNNGVGQHSQNVGLLVTGNATAPVTLYEVSIRALIEAEFRQSFDSYWLKYGSDEWKVAKQGWFEYACANPVTFNVFQEGDMSAPVFTFTLPASATRKTEKIRFPATKATTWRFIATATSDFQLYNESHIEVRPVCGPKGYSREKLMA